MRGRGRGATLAAAALAAAMIAAGCESAMPTSAPASSTPVVSGPPVAASSPSASVVPVASSAAPASSPSAAPAATPPATLVAVAGTPSLPYAVSRAVAFADGTAILVCGGLTATGTTATVLRVNLAGGAATPVGRLADPVHDAAGGVVGGVRLLLGGGRTTQDATAQRVTVSGSTVVGRLPAPRADLAAVAVRSELIVAGGAAGGVSDRSVLATTVGRRYRVVATLPVGVRYAATAALDGRVYLFGGSDGVHDLATIQVIDPVADTARIAGRLPRSLSHATAFVLDGRLFIAGGRHAGRAVDTILGFDPATGAVAPAGHLPRALSDAAAVVVGGNAWLVGGEAATLLTSLVELTPG